MHPKWIFYFCLQLAPLKTQLEMYWPDVISGNHETFWKHEWDKHGKCSLFTQYQYFKVSLNILLNPTFNILAILKAANLNPIVNPSSKPDDIKNAIKIAIGKSPALHCNEDTSDHKQLFEIILCFDTDAVTLIDCSTKLRTSCLTSSTIHDEL